jgi:hypothetical protein
VKEKKVKEKKVRVKKKKVKKRVCVRGESVKRRKKCVEKKV